MGSRLRETQVPDNNSSSKKDCSNTKKGGVLTVFLLFFCLFGVPLISVGYLILGYCRATPEELAVEYGVLNR